MFCRVFRERKMPARRPTMTHKIEITGYTPAHCGECGRWEWTEYANTPGCPRFQCYAYFGTILQEDFFGNRRRCDYCIADEKAQREAAK